VSARDPILEEWIARTIQSYPSAAVPFLSGEEDPFRNPVGQTVRRSLTTLLEQLQGDMDVGRVAPALDAIVRIRAVQNLTASEAVGFVFLLKPILSELAPDLDRAAFGSRLDRLALMAFDKYMQCREQLAEIRVSEGWRSIRRARPLAKESIR
jgi:RsbRD-like negative regulator of sigma factor